MHVAPVGAPSRADGDAEDELVTHVCHRYYQSLYYTQLQEAVLLVLNPFQTAVDVNSEEVLRAYRQAFRDTRYSASMNKLPPHIFRTASHAYFYMQRTGQDQCLFFLGESASGKSETRRLAARALITISSALPGKRGARLAFQLPAALHALECFGHMPTDENLNASGCALYTELQFNKNGRLNGFKMLNYYLERTRVSLLRQTGPTFHIFQLLVAGAQGEDRRRWSLDTPYFRLLGGGREHLAGDVHAPARYARLCDAFSSIGLGAAQVTHVFDVIAALLHLANLDFAFDDGPKASARITTEEPLYIAASLLGVGASALANALTHRTRVVRGEAVTAMLDADSAAANRDALMRMLYSLLFAWVTEHVNTCFASEHFDTYIGLLDMPGWRNRVHNTLETFAVNFAADMAHRHMTRVLLERRIGEMEHEGLSHLAPLPLAADESQRLRLLTHYPGGLVHIMDDQTQRRPRKTAQTMLDAMQRRWVNHGALRVAEGTFTVAHFHGGVEYDVHEWLEQNDASYAIEHVSLLRGAAVPHDGTSGFGSNSAFVRALFRTLPGTTPLARSVRRASPRLERAGTLRATAPKPEGDDTYADADAEPAGPCVLGELRTTLTTLFDVVDEAKAWFVLCVRPNASRLANQCEPRMVRRQLHALGAAQLRATHTSDYCVTLTYVEFCDRYGTLPGLDTLALLGAPRAEAKMRVSEACAYMNWTDTHVAMGMHKVFLSHDVFRELEDALRARDPEESAYQLRKAAADEDEARAGAVDLYAPLVESLADEAPVEPPVEAAHTPAFSYAGEYDADEMQHLLEDEAPMADDVLLNDAADAGPGEAAPPAGPRVTERLRVTTMRRVWVALTWMLTWWVPSFVLKARRTLRRSDVRMAWREKLAINLIIWFICLCSIFVIVFLGNVVCPKQHLYRTGELSGRKGADALTAIRGEVFDYSKIVDAHRAVLPVIGRKTLMQYAGSDATAIFPVQVNALCRGPNGAISPWVTLDDNNATDPNAQYHDFRAFTNDRRPDWYYEQMWYMRSEFRVGMVGYTPKDINDMLDDGRTIGRIGRDLYDLTSYLAQGSQGSVRVPEGMAPPPDLDRTILAPSLARLLSQNAGNDVESRLSSLGLASDLLDDQRACLRNLFYIGRLDERESARCTFSAYLLLSLAIIMVTTVGFKFFAALQFTRSNPPEEHEKFVVCAVPCYTEGTDSIRKTINSLAKLRYDDRRKLLFVVCDGNVIGAGNDATTPELVLSLLGADTEAQVSPRSFVSLGEGNKQHNMARVYSGLYEHAGHLVPFVVVAKCGRPSETSRPGNRGKRDSQLILMRFFNKVHFGAPMSPLELELYHHIKNIIGVNPSFYEYIFQVDADTEVEPTSLSRFVAAMVRDKKVIGLCGETALANEHQSITTMLQVYEYYISHYLVKAFESLFGSITCLPGCFSMFRLRSPDTQRPLFISSAVVDDYAENRVDTLHLKNLLYLGEDRYLTTLVLKHFPDYKTIFVPHARCLTVAPDSWRVLLSQRRRWINSTVHNLVELLRTPQLCGFCLFSMRFIVMIDLLSTLVAPVTIGYLVYLVVVVSVDGGTIPLTSVFLLAALYGLQAIIFLLHRRFDMIGWMLVYICGLPLWSFILPLYSFWHMDDFSWGNTRIVIGEHGERLLVHHEGTFDPAEIPHMTWEAYENELWEHGSQHSDAPLGLRGVAAAPDQDPRYSFADDADAWYEDASLLGKDRPASMLGGERPASLKNDAVSMHHDDLFAAPMAPTNVARASGVSWGAAAEPPAPPDDAVSLVNLNPAPRLPPNEIIRHDIRRMVATCDLATVTKRQLRARLQDMYGCPIDEKKAYINAQIEAALREV